MKASEDWKKARKILCIRLDALGDVLMTTPAIRALKESQHGRKITLLTSPAGARAAPLIPEVDEVIVYEAPWMKASGLKINSNGEYRLATQLSQEGFDAAVIFTVFSQNPLPAALLAYLANIPLRLAHCRENPYQLLTDWVSEQDLSAEGGLRHEVRRQLDLVAAVGCQTDNISLSLKVPESSRRAIRQKLVRAGLDMDHTWLVIHPGASAPSRRYRPDGFAMAAQGLVRDHDIQIVFTGSSSEQELVGEIVSKMEAPAISLAGQLDLAGLAALLEHSPLLISNNTGPVHVAAAVGTPVVDIYALTNPQHTPWNVPHRLLFHDVPCKFCYKSICPLGHHDCLRLVAPQTIAAAALELLGESAAGRSIGRSEARIEL